MPFSAQVREQAMVLAARHCCVCHRFKGLKLEVHHIVPEGERGDSTIENAIVLCFDCHADAGHYNPRHPRGTKFSRAELRAARVRWHDLVERGRVAPSAPQAPLVQARYVVCKNIEVLLELADRDLSRFPFQPSLLVENEPFHQMRGVLQGQTRRIERWHVWGDSFPDGDAYLTAHPDAQVFRSDPGAYPYFDAAREVTREEIAQRVAVDDVVTMRLLQTGLPAEQISRAFTYFEACGPDRIQEIFLLRQLWLVLLAVENMHDRPIVLNALRARHLRAKPSHIAFLDDLALAEEAAMALSNAPIRPHETLLVPIGLVLPPFDAKEVPLYAPRLQELDVACTQSLTRSTIPETQRDMIQLWGAALSPSAIEVRVDEQATWQDVHPLDLGNLYTLDRSWAIGSCPHAFVLYPASRQYWGELFAHTAREFQFELIDLPKDSIGLEIVELEDETTVFWAAATASLSPTVLRQGESVFIRRPDGGVLTLFGAYFPAQDATDLRPSPVVRNGLVRGWLQRAPAESPAGSGLRQA